MTPWQERLIADAAAAFEREARIRAAYRAGIFPACETVSDGAQHCVGLKPSRPHSAAISSANSI